MKIRLRRVCFVTGTRAEFGLMKSVLRAIRDHPKLRLQLIVTGMHLDRTRGYSVKQIKSEGWLDGIEHARLPWRPIGSQPAAIAAATGRAIASIAASLEMFQSDVVMVCGDRVEAFAGASAGHIAGRVVAHVHGGDRALGQIDDSLRHAITKLSHIHFASTRDSARRIARLGEDKWRIHVVGAPGVDGITRDAWDLSELGLPIEPGRYALLVLHPTELNDGREEQRARLVLDALASVGLPRTVVVYPNNDPGGEGIVRCWDRAGASKSAQIIFRRDLPRNGFLGLLKHTAVLVGNSSSGIIEAATFGTPVIDIGDRQKGRLRSQNVVNVPFSKTLITRELRRIWNEGRPKRFGGHNVYAGRNTGKRIADILARMPLDARRLRKLIAY
jgi:UDP-hydrolysing UDP-N-acetyl-D-glucosamine 2-epimerase